MPSLASAVSNAGGLGILTALTQPSPDALRHAIRETRKLTNKPFGVNITILPAINPPDYAAYARAAVEENVRIFETAGSNRKHYPSCMLNGGLINLWVSSGSSNQVLQGEWLYCATQVHHSQTCQGELYNSAFCMPVLMTSSLLDGCSSRCRHCQH